MANTLDKRFFESTRGRIVAMLRGTTKTVNELAEELGLTDNAVRAHLLSLERDGLVAQSGLQKGTRKPHFAYELTSDADKIFPKAYDALINQLITVLKQRLTPHELHDILQEVGRALAGNETSAGDLNNRAKRAVSALEAMGGSARLAEDEGVFVISSGSCPLAAAVAEHPEVCQVVEALLSQIVGAKVQEHCARGNTPRCSFEIANSA